MTARGANATPRKCDQPTVQVAWARDVAQCGIQGLRRQREANAAASCLTSSTNAACVLP